jgi:hypothetical protein
MPSSPTQTGLLLARLDPCLAVYGFIHPSISSWQSARIRFPAEFEARGMGY